MNGNNLGQTQNPQDIGTASLSPATITSLQNNTDNTNLNITGAKGVSLGSLQLSSNFDAKTAQKGQGFAPILTGLGLVLVVSAVLIMTAVKWRDMNGLKPRA